MALPVVGSFTDGFFNIAKILRTMRVYSIEPSRLREMQDPDSGASLKRDGANAASVLEDIKRRMPRDIPRMEQFLSVIVPEEPESSVHPAAAGAVLDLLLMLQKKCRLLLAPIARKYSTLNGLKIDICAS